MLLCQKQIFNHLVQHMSGTLGSNSTLVGMAPPFSSIFHLPLIGSPTRCEQLRSASKLKLDLVLSKFSGRQKIHDHWNCYHTSQIIQMCVCLISQKLNQGWVTSKKTSLFFSEIHINSMRWWDPLFS